MNNEIIINATPLISANDVEVIVSKMEAKTEACGLHTDVFVTTANDALLVVIYDSNFYELGTISITYKRNWCRTKMNIAIAKTDNAELAWVLH